MPREFHRPVRRQRPALPFMLLAVASFVWAGCGSPTGPDLAALSCKCHDQASGGDIVLPARICTDLSDADKVSEDAQSQCDAKETKCFPSCIKIENCGIFEAPQSIGMCPNGSNPMAGGDFGQATAFAASAHSFLSRSTKLSLTSLLLRTGSTVRPPAMKFVGIVQGSGGPLSVVSEPGNETRPRPQA